MLQGISASRSFDLPKIDGESVAKTATAGALGGATVGGVGTLGVGVLVYAIDHAIGPGATTPGVVATLAVAGALAGGVGGGALGGVAGLMDRNGKLGGEGALTLGAIGAGAGAIVGGNPGQRVVGAIVAGSVGAAIGFGVGKLMD